MGRTTTGALAAAALLAGGLSLPAAAAETTAAEAQQAQQSSMAVAPYLYNGWGSPPDPVPVMEQTGVQWFTLAFVLSEGTCTPRWDGTRALDGGPDQATIEAVRAAGGDVVPSFGGWSGNKLEETCGTAGELAGAYQEVIDAYDLK